MRVVQKIQMELGEVNVSEVKFDLRSRDDIPKILRGLQHLYMNEALREQVFTLLASEITAKVDIMEWTPTLPQTASNVPK